MSKNRDLFQGGLDTPLQDQWTIVVFGLSISKHFHSGAMLMPSPLCVMMNWNKSNLRLKHGMHVNAIS